MSEEKTKPKRRRHPMLVPTLIMGVLALALLCAGYFRGHGEHVEGLKVGARMVLPILPMLVFAFVLAGLVQVMIPKEAVARWVGAESGFRGIFLGAFAGSLMPGGPYVNLPIAVGLFKTGASLGCVIAFLTGWSLWAVNRLPLEVGILGWRLTLIRLASILVFPPIAGFLAEFLFGKTVQAP
jgi:uncharacterized membrane protein YraQ (UPF0718 family)